jgi:hypothetical protein
VLGAVQTPACSEPAACRERGATHQAGGPDVAVDTTLVTDPVADPGLFHQLVELRSVLLGHLRADARDLCVDLGLVVVWHVDRRTDRSQQHVRHLQRVPARDVEAVEQPVASHVQVVVECPAGVAVLVPHLVEKLPRLVMSLQPVYGLRVGA